jgi:hypothetical protein
MTISIALPHFGLSLFESSTTATATTLTTT